MKKIELEAPMVGEELIGREEWVYLFFERKGRKGDSQEISLIKIFLQLFPFPILSKDSIYRLFRPNFI